MKRCPNGYRRVGDKCVKVKPVKAQTGSVKTKPLEFRKEINLQKASDPYAQLNRIGNWIYDSWRSRPNIPPFIKESGYAWVYEGAEKAIDIQFELGKQIARGKYRNTELYTPTERDRVESIGFKPVWSTGGFQV